MSRTRQLFPATVFEHLFDHVFAQCVARGLAVDDTQAVDSAPVKSYDSLEAVLEKHAAGAVGPHVAGRNAPSAKPAAPTAPAGHRAVPAAGCRCVWARRAPRCLTPGRNQPNESGTAGGLAGGTAFRRGAAAHFA